MPLAVVSPQMPETDPLLTAENVAHCLNVSTDRVWDHSSRRAPLLPVIRIGDRTLRYLQNQIVLLDMPKPIFQAILRTIAALAKAKGTSRTFKGCCTIRGWPSRPWTSTKMLKIRKETLR